MISVVIPVHNSADYLEEALISVEEQTFGDFEAILVENASTDDSPGICDSFCREHERFRCIHQDFDRGVSASRNKGMKEAKGDLVIFLDSDDAYAPDAFEVMHRALEESGADVVCCGYSFLKEGSGSPAPDPGENALAGGLHGSVITGREFTEGPMLSGDSHCWGKLFRRDAIGDALFPEGVTIGEDMLFLLSAMRGCRKILMADDYRGYLYRTNPGGAMLRPFTGSAMDQIACWEKAAEVLGHTDRIDSIIVTNAVLTASRISKLPPGERKSYGRELETCRGKVLEHYRPSLRSLLPKGYPLKADILRLSSSLYAFLYSSADSIAGAFGRGKTGSGAPYGNAGKGEGSGTGQGGAS